MVVRKALTNWLLLKENVINLRLSTCIRRLILPDVGEVQSLTIGHNNQGPGPEWLLEFVEVCP